MISLHVIVNKITTSKFRFAYSSTPQFSSNGYFKCNWGNQLIGWNNQTVSAVLYIYIGITCGVLLVFQFYITSENNANHEI